MKKRSIDITITKQGVTELSSDSSPTPTLRFPFCREDTGIQDELIEKYEQDSAVMEMKPYHYKEIRNTFDAVQSAFNMSPGAPSFWKYLVAANEVYILDKYYGLTDFRRTIEVLRNHTSLRNYGMNIFIISNSNHQFRKLQNAGGLPFLPKTIIDFAPNPDHLELIHDRFAVLDHHIWHFGAKFAGMHATMNAYSGPWEDKRGALKNFCREFFK